MASERTILLTQLDPTRLDGGKEMENRERKERGEEEKDFRERESTFSRFSGDRSVKFWRDKKQS